MFQFETIWILFVCIAQHIYFNHLLNIVAEAFDCL
jgi:hypothetical protein